MYKCSAVAEMGERLDTTDTGQKLRGYAPFSGKARSAQHNVAWVEAYLRTKWHLDPSSHLL